MPDHYHLFECPGSTRLMIFFTATGAKPGFFNFWQAGQELAADTHVLLVNGWSNTWYQDGVRGLGDGIEGTLAFIRNYRDVHGITDVFCSGQSMGGYGALLFGGLLKAKVIAFGAETILDLPHSQYSRKANRDVQIRYGNLPETFADGLNAVLLAGERDPIDIYCAAQLSNIPGVQVRTMRYVGHGPAGYLRNRDRLIPYLRSQMAGEPVPDMPEFGSALDRPGFSETFYRGWCALRDKQFETARDFLTVAVKSYSACDEARVLLARSLEGLNDFENALANYAVANAIIQRPDALLGVSNCLRRAGQVADAWPIALKATRLWPEDPDCQYAAGLCLVSLRRHAEALSFLEKASALAPSNPSFAARHALTRKQLGMPT